MFKKVYTWLGQNIVNIVLNVALLVFVVLFVAPKFEKQTADIGLKDFKDGIQNHLTWSIKGECFFVKPHTETSVYLIRVPDCDKK